MTLDAVTQATILSLVKARLNRLESDTSLDDYLKARICAAIQETERTGLRLANDTESIMYVVDYTVWSYQNRDNPNGMPDWLRLRRREMWLRSGGGADDP